MYQSIEEAASAHQPQPDLEEASTEAFVAKKRSNNFSAFIVIGLLSMLFIGVSLRGRFQFTGFTTPTSLDVDPDEDTSTEEDRAAPLLGKAIRHGDDEEPVNYLCIKYGTEGFNWARDSLIASGQTRLYFDTLGKFKIVDIVVPTSDADTTTRVVETYNFNVVADQAYFQPDGALKLYKGETADATPVFSTPEAYGDGFWLLLASNREKDTPGSLSFYGKYHKGVPSFTTADSSPKLGEEFFNSRLKKCKLI